MSEPRFSIEERADRLQRRKRQWPPDRNTYDWSMLRLGVAIRDAGRAMRQPFGIRQRLDFEPFWGVMEKIGAVYLVIAVVVFALLVTGVIR